MDTWKIKNDLLLSKYAEEIKAQQESGLSIREWCKENGIPTSTFTLHQRKIREAVLGVNEELSRSNKTINLAHVQFQPSEPAKSNAAISLVKNGISIEINNNASTDLIKCVFEVLQNA